MSKAYEFLQECGSFVVITMNGDSPVGRPFGAVMEEGDDLYLATNDMNEVHKQMRANEKIQIVAQKKNSMEWIRITGISKECNDEKLKQKMLENCPIVKEIFDKTGIEHFLLFKVEVNSVEIK